MKVISEEKPESSQKKQMQIENFISEKEKNMEKIKKSKIMIHQMISAMVNMRQRDSRH